MIYRPDIDGLRAVAVLPVVFYHAGIPGPSGGFLGVDVFFVISGFLITSIVADEIDRGSFYLISFYERRARRILPALTIVVLASFAAGWFVLLPGEMQRLGASGVAVALFLSNVYFDLTLDYFGPAAEFAPLLHTWSLAVEEQFYVCFPLLLMSMARWGWHRPFLIVAGLSLLSFAGAVLVLPLKPDWVFYQILFRAWELGAGAILALAAFRAPERRLVREAVAAAGLLAILVPVFVYDAGTPFPGLAALPPVLGAAVLIWIGTPGGGSLVTAALSVRGLVWIGLISYSLYLWHWPLLAFPRIALNTAILPQQVAWTAVVLSVLLAWISYRFVERPFRMRPPEGLGRPSVFAAAALSLAAMVAAGGAMHALEGLPSRFPASVVDIAAVAKDRSARRDECFEVLPRDGLCRIGAPAEEDAPADFLFWGDSHAEAVMAGMDRAAKSRHKSGMFTGLSGCPPIRNVQRRTNGAKCARFNESVLSWIEGRPDIPVVILGARWTLSVEGTRYRGEAGSEVRLEWTGPSSARFADRENPTLVEHGLHETVTALRRMGRRVVLLGPVPEIGYDVPATTARTALHAWLPETILSRSAYEARARRTEKILSRVAAAHEGVRYLPLSDLFCDPVLCRTKSDSGVPLYVDDDHISETTAKQLLPPRLGKIWRIAY